MAAHKKNSFLQDIEGLLGDPQQVDRELRRFAKDTTFLSTNRAKLTKRYPDQWIAIRDAKVRASGKALADVLSQIDADGLPRERTVVDFLDTMPKTLIL
jgi:hypothetical protein